MSEVTRVDTVRTIETPEGVELMLRVAGPLPRGLAWSIDVVVRTFVYMVLLMGLSFLGDLGTGIWYICVFLGEWFYPVFFEIFNKGMTPGKQMLGLVVVHDDGTPVGWNASLLRNLLRVADFLPVGYLLGILSMLISRDFKRLGDLAAGTAVTYRPRPKPPERLPEVTPMPASLPLKVDEQRAIIDYAARSADWTPERARELADVLEGLSGASGEAGVERLQGIARWLQGARPS